MSMEELSVPMEALVIAAQRVAERAYAPYSQFRVGAALLLTNGEVVTGANVENASYGLTICAERSALVRAVAEFGPEIRIAAVAVVNLNRKASPPCGACRQMLAEFVSAEAPVCFPEGHDGATLTSVEFCRLLPHGFRVRAG